MQVHGHDVRSEMPIYLNSIFFSPIQRKMAIQHQALHPQSHATNLQPSFLSLLFLLPSECRHVDIEKGAREVEPWRIIGGNICAEWSHVLRAKRRSPKDPLRPLQSASVWCILRCLFYMAFRVSSINFIHHHESSPTIHLDNRRIFSICKRYTFPRSCIVFPLLSAIDGW